MFAKQGETFSVYLNGMCFTITLLILNKAMAQLFKKQTLFMKLSSRSIQLRSKKTKKAKSEG